MDERAIISAVDVDNLFRVPRLFHEQGLDDIVLDKLGVAARDADLSEWDAVIDAVEHPSGEVNIAMVGKYTGLTDSYKSLAEALIHAGIHTRTTIDIHYIDSEDVEHGGTDRLRSMDAIIVPGGFGDRGIEGKIATAALRQGKPGAVPGHLPGDAGGGHRVCPARSRHERGGQY